MRRASRWVDWSVRKGWSLNVEEWRVASRGLMWRRHSRDSGHANFATFEKKGETPQLSTNNKTLDAMRKLIAGNWKMNLDRGGGRTCQGNRRRNREVQTVDLLVCPPACIRCPSPKRSGTPVAVGAQNMYRGERRVHRRDKCGDAEGRRLQVRHPGPQRAAAHLPRNRRRREQEDPGGAGGRVGADRVRRRAARRARGRQNGAR